ncbi:sigma 54-interacting transcriptional regulator [Pleionea litopenaei]|uniref:HTH-type transcriptional regulatory protein TyrR n=1 Tax=Pleionea litopenaei TaxID=3070815 RepID=A0AA51X717_9GAMM|nr:sigma 54-interacting transcriptional regulator [Pleionea sp. HL-JVS1]WMS87728.1 sigma 54-interacting transcriptional regulator [Pleionea sp. HL-JVS1]
MKRLALQCEDRLGVVQDVVSLITEQKIDLRGIELTDKQLFLRLKVSESIAKQLSADLLTIAGIHKVHDVSLMPSEREHQELKRLMDHFPEAVASIDRQGLLVSANQGFYQQIEQLGVTSQAIDQLIDQQHLNELFRQLDAHRSAELTLTKQQRTLYIEAIATATGDNGRVEHALVILRVPSEMVSKLEHWNRDRSIPFAHLVASSQVMKQLCKEAQRFATLNEPLLIEGETGTGKEVFARATHIARSPDKPFLALNCASLPDSAAENELFGFIDSTNKSAKPGLIELAEGGTLYFDEIGEMSPYLQVKLLRFLETGRFRKVGSEREVAIQVKVIASTQRNLKALCKQGSFREDLYYRLNVLNLVLPPLRSRRDDIIPLANHFLELGCKRLDRSLVTMSKRAQLVLARYNWPGNIRELENIIFRGLSKVSGTQLSTRHLNMPMLRSLDIELIAGDDDLSHKEIMKNFERQLLEYLYPLYPSSRRLAEKLHLSHTSIANKLREFGLEQSN